MSSYKPIVIDITEKQLADAINGKSIRITASQLGKGTKVLMLHPLNSKKAERSMLNGKTFMLKLADGELAATYERMINSGGSFFSNLWKGLKRTWGVLKDTGAASQLLDMAVGPASVYTGQPALVGAVRRGIKDLTGAGVGRMTAAQRKAALKASGLYLSN
jgi:hypothetical protein